MAKLGQQVDVYCGRCKVERYHTVAALGPGGRIERIVCGYCHTARNYKDPAATPARAAAAGTRTRRAAPDPMPTSPPKPYSPGERYEKGDFVSHSKYGVGRVSDVRNDRIDVKFTDGTSRVFLHRGD
jgi:hypothetical protein